jgi:hypothetical protein
MSNRKQDELDGALDAALAKYTAVEPRGGIEDRVLANLRAELERVPDRAWWRWGLAAAPAAALVVALTLAIAPPWRSGKPSQPLVASHPAIAPPIPKAEAQLAHGDGNRATLRRHKSDRKMSAHPPGSATVVAANPKLDQFPSPQPLSEQEKLLQNYVARYPEHAVLVARALTNALRPDQLKGVATFPSSDDTGDSKDQNDDTRDR